VSNVIVQEQFRERLVPRPIGPQVALQISRQQPLAPAAPPGPRRCPSAPPSGQRALRALVAASRARRRSWHHRRCRRFRNSGKRCDIRLSGAEPSRALSCNEGTGWKGGWYSSLASLWWWFAMTTPHCLNLIHLDLIHRNGL